MKREVPKMNAHLAHNFSILLCAFIESRNNFNRSSSFASKNIISRKQRTIRSIHFAPAIQLHLQFVLPSITNNLPPKACTPNSFEVSQFLISPCKLYLRNTTKKRIKGWWKSTGCFQSNDLHENCNHPNAKTRVNVSKIAKIHALVCVASCKLEVSAGHYVFWSTVMHAQTFFFLLFRIKTYLLIEPVTIQTFLLYFYNATIDFDRKISVSVDRVYFFKLGKVLHDTAHFRAWR